ncbi:hypothetical protein [Lentzea sp. NPDC051838]|uniref:hypothetical protein n=1 Tax=Lentzea sp. NPDC051838 TaxID=3154849 RepID=UPI00343073AF
MAKASAGYWPSSRFLQVGGGSGFRGLHGHPDVCGGVVVAAGGGGGAGFVTAGGGVVVFFVGCCVSEVEGGLDSVVFDWVGFSVELGEVLGVEVVQLEDGVLFGGASSATPWIAIPTRTPSNAEPSTAEPPAAHSARTAVLLEMLTGCGRVITPSAQYRVGRLQENAHLLALSAP